MILRSLNSSGRNISFIPEKILKQREKEYLLASSNYLQLNNHKNLICGLDWASDEVLSDTQFLLLFLKALYDNAISASEKDTDNIKSYGYLDGLPFWNLSSKQAIILIKTRYFAPVLLNKYKAVWSDYVFYSEVIKHFNKVSQEILNLFSKDKLVVEEFKEHLLKVSEFISINFEDSSKEMNDIKNQIEKLIEFAKTPKEPLTIFTGLMVNFEINGEVLNFSPVRIESIKQAKHFYSFYLPNTEKMNEIIKAKGIQFVIKDFTKYWYSIRLSNIDYSSVLDSEGRPLYVNYSPSQGISTSTSPRTFVLQDFYHYSDASGPVGLRCLSIAFLKLLSTAVERLGYDYIMDEITSSEVYEIIDQDL